MALGNLIQLAKETSERLGMGAKNVQDLLEVQEIGRLRLEMEVDKQVLVNPLLQ